MKKDIADAQRDIRDLKFEKQVGKMKIGLFHEKSLGVENKFPKGTNCPWERCYVHREIQE